MLQIAAPEAIVRLECTPLSDKKAEITRIYFKDQYHMSIDDLLDRFILTDYFAETGLLVQVCGLFVFLIFMYVLYNANLAFDLEFFF